MGRPSGNDSELGGCANVFRVLFIIFNAIFIVFGAIGLAGAIYSLVISETYGFITGSDNVSGAAIFLVVSLVLIAISVIGIVGAVLKWRPMLLIYAIIWTVLVLLGVISAIISFYYSDNVSSAAEEQYRNGWERAIKEYNTSSETRRVVDAFQERGQCCGLDNATDWIIWAPSVFVNNSNRLPNSCSCTSGDDCREVDLIYRGVSYRQFAYDKGCYDVTVEYFQIGSLVSGILGIIFAVIEIFGAVVAVGLVFCITSARKKQVV